MASVFGSPDSVQTARVGAQFILSALRTSTEDAAYELALSGRQIEVLTLLSTVYNASQAPSYTDHPSHATPSTLSLHKSQNHNNARMLQRPTYCVGTSQASQGAISHTMPSLSPAHLSVGRVTEMPGRAPDAGWAFYISVNPRWWASCPTTAFS
jgi:hypothetical protein